MQLLLKRCLWANRPLRARYAQRIQHCSEKIVLNRDALHLGRKVPSLVEDLSDWFWGRRTWRTFVVGGRRQTMRHSGDSNAELISIQFNLFKNFIPHVFPFTGRIITLFFCASRIVFWRSAEYSINFHSNSNQGKNRRISNKIGQAHDHAIDAQKNTHYNHFSSVFYELNQRIGFMFPRPAVLLTRNTRWFELCPDQDLRTPALLNFASNVKLQGSRQDGSGGDRSYKWRCVLKTIYWRQVFI